MFQALRGMIKIGHFYRKYPGRGTCWYERIISYLLGTEINAVRMAGSGGRFRMYRESTAFHQYHHFI